MSILLRPLCQLFLLTFIFSDAMLISIREVILLTCGERIRELRKKSGLTMEKFGERLGVGKTAISKIENDERNLTGQMILSICREFEVNEDWLRYGIGEMYTPITRSETIAKFAGSLMKEPDDSFKKRLFEALALLDENEWEILARIADKLTKKD